MNFEQYMNENIPTWKRDLSEQVISDLRALYNDIDSHKKRIDNIFDLAFKTKSGIDYSTDLAKANDDLAFNKAILKQKIEQINKVIMGLDVTEDIYETNKNIK